MASFSWQLGAHPPSSCSHSGTADNDNNNKHNEKRHDSLVHFVRSLHCIHPPPSPPGRPPFPSQARIGRSTINLFLNPLLNVCRFPEGALPSLGLFTPTPFFSFFFFFFSASRKGCAAARCLCWMQETDALQEIWKQTGSPRSSGLLFTYTSLPSPHPPSSNPPAFRLERAELPAPTTSPPRNKKTSHSVFFVL